MAYDIDITTKEAKVMKANPANGETGKGRIPNRKRVRQGWQRM
jgi:hypothetical protein